jgi:predicted Fe-Mo cluster-binding NifX family protein
VEASSTTISDTIPAALARIRLHAEQSLQAISAADARTESLSQAAHTVRSCLAEADTLLERQRNTLGEVGGSADSRLAALIEQTRMLEELLAKADAEVNSLSEGASGKLTEALAQVRDMAAKAADEARDTLTAAIPRVAQRMSESAARAMSTALADVGKKEIADVSSSSERAIQAAQIAAERLSRHLLAIAETATAIEARIEANRADTETHDEQSFARATSLLIEALNSTSIDVAKIFSNEVTDEEWKAYLRGDRSIFTRRAVKLLERTEAQAIAQRYNEDGEFREQVNRYIHDFEALLRRVMATREGTALATTMLSSDAGKLYVALAQAIERLRR